MTGRNTDEWLDPLTERERTVLQLIADGLSNKEISEELTLSLHTVNWYVKQIFEKLHVRRRTQAVAVAQSQGLLPTSPPPPGPRLPAPVTPLVGREAEVSEVTRLLDDPDLRLVTLLGPGGIGKTRLALEIATQLHERLPGGVCWVALERVSSPDDVAPAVAVATGFQLGGKLEPVQQLLDGLRQRQMLLVMDNFEHLLQAASFVGDLLVAAPGISILATSRERLNLRGETLFSLKGLEYPTGVEQFEDYSALRLFVRTARRVQPAFQPSAEDLLHISRVCALVEGMPLGIELAAAWLDVLSPEHLVDELEQSVSVLQTQSRDVPERHQSIYAVFEQSWALLSEEEWGAYKKLSVFRGGFDRAAAEHVAGASLFMLSTLVDKSLVTRTGPDRYQLHELLRQVTHEKLAASEEEYQRIRDDHCAYFASLAQQFETVIKTEFRSAGAFLAKAQADYENLLAGWHRALERLLLDRIGAYAYPMGWMFDGRGLGRMAVREFGAALDVMRAYPERVQTPDLIKVLTFLGNFNLALEDYDAARQLLDEAMDLAEPLLGTHFAADFALHTRGWLHHLEGHTATARQQLTQSLEMSRQTGLTLGIWENLAWLGEIEFDQGNYEAAAQYHRDALALSEREEFPLGVLLGMSYLGICLCALGDCAAGRDQLRMALDLNRDFMIVPPLLLAVGGVAALYGYQGRREPALEMLALTLRHNRLGLAARLKARSLLTHFRSLFSDEAVDAVLEKAEQGQYSGRSLEPNFTIDPQLIDRLHALIDEAM
jgi:predicted ATPase/DNA-binding CsgD family transcriptional regulator